MSNNQRNFAGLFAFLVLALLAVFVFLCAISATYGQLSGAQGVGALLLSIIQRADALKHTFHSLILIVGICVGVLSALTRKSRLLWVTSTIALIGIAACLMSYLKIHDGDIAYNLFFYSDPPITYDELQAGSANLFGSLSGWFVSVLASQLGISKLVERNRRSGQRENVSSGKAPSSAHDVD